MIIWDNRALTCQFSKVRFLCQATLRFTSADRDIWINKKSGFHLHSEKKTQLITCRPGGMTWPLRPHSRQVKTRHIRPHVFVFRCDMILRYWILADSICCSTHEGSWETSPMVCFKDPFPFQCVRQWCNEATFIWYKSPHTQIHLIWSHQIRKSDTVKVLHAKWTTDWYYSETDAGGIVWKDKLYWKSTLWH